MTTYTPEQLADLDRRACEAAGIEATAVTTDPAASAELVEAVEEKRGVSVCCVKTDDGDYAALAGESSVYWNEIGDRPRSIDFFTKGAHGARGPTRLVAIAEAVAALGKEKDDEV